MGLRQRQWRDDNNKDGYDDDDDDDDNNEDNYDNDGVGICDGCGSIGRILAII